MVTVSPCLACWDFFLFFNGSDVVWSKVSDISALTCQTIWLNSGRREVSARPPMPGLCIFTCSRNSGDATQTRKRKNACFYTQPLQSSTTTAAG